MATYHSWKVEAPAPTTIAGAAVRIGPNPVTDLRGEEAVALEEVARTWVTSSNGTTRAVAVEGDAALAIAGLLTESTAMATPVEGRRRAGVDRVGRSERRGARPTPRDGAPDVRRHGGPSRCWPA